MNRRRAEEPSPNRLSHKGQHPKREGGKNEETKLKNKTKEKKVGDSQHDKNKVGDRKKSWRLAKKCRYKLKDQTPKYALRNFR